jgi:hypothetical protein
VGPGGGAAGPAHWSVPGWCVTGAVGAGGSPAYPRSSTQAPCTATPEPAQHFEYDAASRQLRSQGGLCLEAGSSSHSDGSVLLAPCNASSTAQAWIVQALPPGPPYPPLPDTPPPTPGPSLPPTRFTSTVAIDLSTVTAGWTYDGHGALSAGASSRLLYDCEWRLPLPSTVSQPWCIALQLRFRAAWMRRLNFTFNNYAP